MSLLDVFTGGIDDIARLAVDTIDEFVETPDEKRKVAERIEQRAHEIKLKTEDTAIATVQAQGRVIEAEMKQGDNYTKRARPTIVYAGLFFIFICYILVPIFTLYLTDGKKSTGLELPAEFWWAWTTVCSVWAMGRTAEKLKPGGRADKLLNTTEPYVDLAKRILRRGS